MTGLGPRAVAAEAAAANAVSAPLPPPPEHRARAIVHARSYGFCEACGHRTAASIQHRVKRGQGGTWSPANLLHLCGDGTTGCHGIVEANPDLGRELGLGLRSGDDPTAEPAYLHTVNGTGWWLLDTDGGYGWVDPETVSQDRRSQALEWDRLRAA